MNLDPASRIPDDIHLLIAQLMEIDPGHDLIRDIRFALEIGDLRAGMPLNLDDYIGGRYHRNHELPEHTALQKARWGPTGDRDQWVAPREGDFPGTAQQRNAA